MTKLAHRNLPHLTEIAHSGVMGDMVVDVVSKGVSPKDAAAKAERRLLQLIAEAARK